MIAGFAFMGFAPSDSWARCFWRCIGNIIHYQISAALATTAFLWEEAYSMLMVKNMIVNLLCGELIPLNLFPAVDAMDLEIDAVLPLRLRSHPVCAGEMDASWSIFGSSASPACGLSSDGS